MLYRGHLIGKRQMKDIFFGIQFFVILKKLVYENSNQNPEEQPAE